MLTAHGRTPETDSDVAMAIMEDISCRNADPIEGIWRLRGENSVIGIKAVGIDRYEMVVIDCPMPEVTPGTVMGTLRNVAKDGTYDADISTRLSGKGGMGKKTADFVLTLRDDGRVFTMRHYFKGTAVRLWRLVPYLFRYSVKNVDNRPEDMDGCVKVWPASDGAGYGSVTL